MIGRKTEIEELNRLYDSKKAEFVAVYGRRRVGKTYLIDETFKNRITFRHAGLSPIEAKNDPSQRPLKMQLQAFYYSLLQHGMPKSHCPKDWIEAFFMLEMYLQSIDDGQRQLVFLDELPWMDTPRSAFITAFEAFWNSWGCHRDNLMLVVCGSANSWIMDKLINNHGGLYGRLTYEIKLQPFTLKENEEFLKEKGVILSRYDIAQSYMIVGGIPYYLNYFREGKSLPQNIDELFFADNAKLKFEYDRLFDSIFSNPNLMKRMVELLATKSSGYTRKEISERLKIADGGTLTASLSALTASDFVIKYVPFGKNRKEEHFKLIDPFCLFCNKFLAYDTNVASDFWQTNANAASIVAWRGFAFENVCFNHIRQIKQGLGITGVSSNQAAWSSREADSDGTQIDMIISRRDNIVNMCEMKFYGDDFVVDKAYDRKLRQREILLAEIVPKKSVIHSTLITTFGLKYNEYSGIFTNVLTLDDLFE